MTAFILLSAQANAPLSILQANAPLSILSITEETARQESATAYR
jgi:hypothetical protein